MSKADQRATESHLEILMMHIIKILIQPLKKTNIWLISIKNAQKKIKDIQKSKPFLNRNFF